MNTTRTATKQTTGTKPRNKAVESVPTPKEETPDMSTATLTHPEKPAPALLPKFDFADVEVPKATTFSPTNPFTDKVAELVANWDGEEGRSVKAVSFAVPTAAFDRVAAQISRAVKAVEKSPRITKTMDADTQTTTVTFWAVEKIVRKRTDKPAETPADEPSTPIVA